MSDIATKMLWNLQSRCPVEQLSEFEALREKISNFFSRIGYV